MLLSKLFRNVRAKALVALAGVTMVLGVGAAISAGVAQKESEVVETKAASDSTTYKVIYFNNTSGWTNPTIHYWGGTDGTSWPGAAMTRIGSSAYWAIRMPSDNNNCIFSNNGSSQTGDITSNVTDGNCYKYSDGSWSKYTASTIAWTVSGLINGSSSWVDDVYSETSTGSTVISGYFKANDMFKLRYGPWLDQVNSSVFTDLTNYVCAKAPSEFFEAGTHSDTSDNIKVKQSGYYTFSFASNLHTLSNANKKGSILVTYSPMTMIQKGYMLIWAATDDGNWQANQAITALVADKPSSGYWHWPSYSHIYKKAAGEVHYYGYVVPDNVTTMYFQRRNKTNSQDWGRTPDASAINTTSVYYIGYTGDDKYCSEAAINSGESDRYIFASMLTGFFTCGSSSTKTNGKTQYSTINTRFYSSALSSTEKSGLSSVNIVDYANGAYSGNGNSYNGKTPDTSITAAAKWAALPSGGASSARIVPGSTNAGESPLTMTLWIVLASGLAGLAAIGTAYFVSKKKKRPQA